MTPGATANGLLAWVIGASGTFLACGKVADSGYSGETHIDRRATHQDCPGALDECMDGVCVEPQDALACEDEDCATSESGLVILVPDPYVPGPTVECEEIRVPGRLAWFESTEQFDCEYGRCAAFHHQLDLAMDGSLVVSAPLYGGTVDAPAIEVGALWLAHFDRGGTRLSSSTPISYSLTRTSHTQFDRAGVLADGSWLMRELIAPTVGDRFTSVYRRFDLSGEERPVQTEPDSPAIFAVSPTGGFVSAHAREGSDEVSVHVPSDEFSDPAKVALRDEAEVVRLDSSGQVLWRRAWASPWGGQAGGFGPGHLGVVAVDNAGYITVESLSGPELDQPSVEGTYGESLTRLDPQGRVIAHRRLGQLGTPRPSPDGATYQVNDVLERYDGLARSEWRLRLPVQGFLADVTSTGDAVLLVVLSSATRTRIGFLAVSPDSRTCTITEAEVDFCRERISCWQGPEGRSRSVVRARGDGSYYVATALGFGLVVPE